MELNIGLCSMEYVSRNCANNLPLIFFQVPVIQILLGQVDVVSGDQMLSIWRYVVVGAVVAAAVLTPSTDPLTQMLLAGPLLGLYLGGAWAVKLTGK